MDFRFTVSVEGLGAHDIAEDNAMALIDAFERTHPEVGAAVGADLENGSLEASFCASGPSLDDAAASAKQIFANVADASGLKPTMRIDSEAWTRLREPV